jgi:hypothetical protein
VAEANEWKERDAETLAKLDIASEYRTLGVTFTRDTPTDKGWLACHAVDRKDGTASAAVNVGIGPARGRYRDMGGEGLSLNLWEFAAKFGRFPDWRAARKHFAERAGVELPKTGDPKRPDDAVEFQHTPASTSILKGWAEDKGSTLAAVRDNGGKYARYPKKATDRDSQYVVAFPAYNPPGLTDAEPSAWIIANTTGGPVILFKGKGKKPAESKTLSVGGSVGGLLGAYALRALTEEKDGGPPVEVVWKVEGLTDMLAMHAALAASGLLGKHVVISNSQGTLESVKPEWCHLLAGKTVYVVHDCDRPGQTGAGRWCYALAPLCPVVKDVRLPYPVKENHGEDLRDFLVRDKKPLSDLLVIASDAPAVAVKTTLRDAPMFSPLERSEPLPVGFMGLTEPGADPSATSHPLPTLPTTTGAGGLPTGAVPLSRQGRDADSLLDLVGIDVLGEYTSDKSKIDVYSRFCQKVVPIDSIDHFSYRKLIQMCGDAAFMHIHDGRDPVEGKHTMEEVRQAVAFRAGETDLSRVGMLGQGIWKTDTHFVIVNGGTAAIYDRKTHVMARITNPRLGRHTIVDLSATESWVDFAVLNDLVAKASDPAWAMAALQEAATIFSNWNWKHPQDAWTTALLVASTFVQTTLAWRPEVAITGPSDCGKSTLMGVLTSMFGKLNLYVQKPTEAGLRQHMSNTARAVLIDEFENDLHRQKILELLRVTSQGGTVIRGSSDQKGKTFQICHLPWMAAIESGLVKAADRNRFIILDLQAIPPRNRGKVTLPGELVLNDLGLKLCAVALRYSEEASRIFKDLKGTNFEGIHGRVVESFSVPASLRAAIGGCDKASAVRGLGELLADRSSISRQGGGDEADLMKTILDSTFHVGNGQAPVSVSVVISDTESYMRYSETLESQGIAMTEGRPGVRRPVLEGKKYVFLDMEKVKRFLLKGTSWYPLDCEQLLLRLPGAKRAQRMLGRQRIWGLELLANDWVEACHPEEKIESLFPLDPTPDYSPPAADVTPPSHDGDKTPQVNHAYFAPPPEMAAEVAAAVTGTPATADAPAATPATVPTPGTESAPPAAAAAATAAKRPNAAKAIMDLKLD